MDKIRAILQLVRPANVLTAVADIWGGAAISYGILGLFLDSDLFFQRLGLLTLSSAFLYAGGVVLNDYNDARIDAVERPERPIPRGAVSRPVAGWMGGSMLIAGGALASFCSTASGLLALFLLIFILLYNFRLKPDAWLGPLSMGICRSLNLLLGISVVPGLLSTSLAWGMGLLPLVFIAAVTVISRGEVMGGNRKAMQFSLALYLLLTAVLVILAIWRQSPWYAWLFAAAWAWLALGALSRALRTLEPAHIRITVKSGVLSLILLDASYAAVFNNWESALLITCLLPVSVLLARTFAVT